MICICQFLVQMIVGETTEGYDLVRTLRMAGYGMVIIGPSLHFWFNFVSRVFPKRDLLSTFTKMALGQTVYGPSVTAIFFSVNAALQGIIISYFLQLYHISCTIKLNKVYTN